MYMCVMFINIYEPYNSPRISSSKNLPDGVLVAHKYTLGKISAAYSLLTKLLWFALLRMHKRVIYTMACRIKKCLSCFLLNVVYTSYCCTSPQNNKQRHTHYHIVYLNWLTRFRENYLLTSFSVCVGI